MTIDGGNDMQFVLKRVSSRCLHRRLSAELLYKVCKEPAFHFLECFFADLLYQIGLFPSLVPVFFYLLLKLATHAVNSFLLTLIH